METPTGIDFDRGRSKALKLKKNVYGLKQAGRNWWLKLSEGLDDMGFKPREADPCVWIHKDAVILVYVDNYLIFSRSKATIKEIIKDLKHRQFASTDEGEIESYLGVEVNRMNDGSIEIKQPFLINRILSAVGCTESATHKVPAVKPLLGKDPEGEKRLKNWHYRSVIGMLNFLAGSTRPDMAFMVHQCARFSADPKKCHETAVKRIARYLQGTEKQGMIFTPDKSRGMECYVDADFARGWNTNDSDDPTTLMSRTGYVILYAGCPITFVSKLQTECALSTTKAEYILLSQAMREVIPTMQLINEFLEVSESEQKPPTVKCTLFEDNNGAIKLVTAPKMRPRTKHIALKYHHFREHVCNGTVKIKRIDTAEQIADIVTKPLPESIFEYLR